MDAEGTMPPDASEAEPAEPASTLPPAPDRSEGEGSRHEGPAPAPSLVARDVPADASGVKSPARAPAPAPNAPLRAARAFVEQGGWKVLELQLDDDSGSVTIRARREENHLAVAVGFSDPVLRAHALNHAERLHAAIQSRYDSAVELSLLGGETGGSRSGRQAERFGPGGSPTGGVADDLEGARPLRELPAGSLHVWTV
jgi:hypothetical protein